MKEIKDEKSSFLKVIEQEVFDILNDKSESTKLLSDVTSVESPSERRNGLDDIVKALRLDNRVRPNVPPSEIMEKRHGKNQHGVGTLFDPDARKSISITDARAFLDAQFIVRGYLAKICNENLERLITETDFSYLKQEYHVKQMWRVKPETFLSKNAMKSQWQGRPADKDVMFWRWERGIAFMDYEDRISAEADRILEYKGIELMDFLKDVANIIAIGRGMRDKEFRLEKEDYSLVGSVLDRLNIDEDLEEFIEDALDEKKTVTPENERDMVDWLRRSYPRDNDTDQSPSRA